MHRVIKWVGEGWQLHPTHPALNIQKIARRSPLRELQVGQVKMFAGYLRKIVLIKRRVFTESGVCTDTLRGTTNQNEGREGQHQITS